MRRKMTSKRALQKLSYVPIFEDDDSNMITDTCCCVYVGDLCEVYDTEVNTIKKDLDLLDKLEKAFDTLSKDDEKAKKLLSLEIEKNRKLQIIEEKFDIEVFETKSLDGKVKYIIDIRPKTNKYSNMSENSLTKEEYDLLKELEDDK